MKKSFILHNDTLTVLDELTDEQAGKLFKTIAAYNNGQIGELDPMTRIIFAPFRAQFDRDKLKWEKIKEFRVSAGSKGGKQKVANASKSKQVLAKGSKAKQETLVSVSDSVSDSVSVKEQNNNVGEPDRFVKFISWFNEHTPVNGKPRKFKPAKAVKAKFEARLKEGYGGDELARAVRNAYNSQHHRETNYKYLTPEFILRPDKLEMFVNAETTNPKLNYAG